MLNAEGDENGIKINRSNWQKKKKNKTKQIARAAHFFF